MALPLPNVLYDVGPGGRVVTGMRGANALTQSNLENEIRQAQAQYAPYTSYADAASKIAYANMLPYQIQATVMSNPLLWMAMKDNPQAMQEMMTNFANSVPKGNQLFGGVNLPNPSQFSGMPRSGGLFNTLVGLLTNQGNQPVSQNAMQSIPTDVKNANPMNVTAPSPQEVGGTSPLVPASKGGVSGVSGKMTAPYVGEPQKPGTTFYDPDTGEIISSPTEGTRTAFQQSINAAKRVAPQLEQLADAAQPFMTAKGLAKMQYERGKNIFNLGEPGKLPTQYAKFQSLIQSAPEALVKSYGLRPTNETIDRMQKVIEPYFGETKDDYKNRILSTLENIKNEQIGVSQEQLSQGFTVGENKSGVKKLAKGLTLPKFNSKKEFQDWYASQSKMVQDAVKLHLQEK